MKKKLSKLKKGKTLVSIRRDSIDANSIQGFILDYSKELILIQYVYDFHLDGLMVLRLSDITDISSSQTDIFQTNILKNESLYSMVAFKEKYNVTGWKSVFENIASKHRFIIAENEAPEDIDDPSFILGEVVKIGKKSVTLHGFTGPATWFEKPVKLKFKDISSFQAGNNYAKTYERYFERNALTRPSNGHSR
jgi:hypothetical protein